MMSGGNFIICGDFCHATHSDSMVILRDRCLGVVNGKIAFIDDKTLLKDRLSEYSLQESDVISLQDRQFVMPGLVDTHIHAPQYPNAGKGLDMPLLKWLDKYTFPTEAKFHDLQYALSAYWKAVTRVLHNGTTTACYFATIDTDATLVLCDVIAELGQRALVGKVNMNQNSPDFYVENSVDESVKETERFVESVLQNKSKYPLITPVVTPRFAIACNAELMQRLGAVAKRYDIPIQTHICETKDEVSFVSQLFPNAQNYADVYDKAGLLTEKTVLAHGIYLTQTEIDVIKSRQSAVSHCPNSNLSLRSGLLDLQNLLKQNVKVGLGTDVSGGYHPSILNAIRTAVFVSNTYEISKQNDYTAISAKDAFKLATLGGARALALDDKIGNFEVGKEFDAFIVDPCSTDSAMDIFDDDNLEDCIEKFLNLGDDRNIVSIFVAGKQVHKKQ